MKIITNGMRGAALLVAAFAFSAGGSFAQFSTPVHDVDNPARQPAKLTVNIAILSGNSSVQKTLVTVPAGKRLVIEYVNIGCSGSAPPSDAELFEFINNSFAGTLSLPFSTPFVVGENLRFYYDPGSRVDVSIFNTTSSLLCSVAVSGYYVNLP
jgi:hypothetical protein